MLEPTYRIVAVKPRPQRAQISTARATALAKKAVFALLERLGLCHMPRVLAAQCVVGESLLPVIAIHAGE